MYGEEVNTKKTLCGKRTRLDPTQESSRAKKKDNRRRVGVGRGSCARHQSLYTHSPVRIGMMDWVGGISLLLSVFTACANVDRGSSRFGGFSVSCLGSWINGIN